MHTFIILFIIIMLILYSISMRVRKDIKEGDYSILVAVTMPTMIWTPVVEAFLSEGSFIYHASVAGKVIGIICFLLVSILALGITIYGIYGPGPDQDTEKSKNTPE